MSKPIIKILFGTVIIGEVKTNAEFVDLLDRVETDMCKLTALASLASLLPNEKFKELMSKNISKLKTLERLTIPTESYELYRAWVKVNDNVPIALIYSADNPSDCFTLTGEAAERDIECQDEDGDTYERLKQIYTTEDSGSQGQSVN